AELLLGHHGALDVPARPAAPPRRVPRRVLTGLRRLPQREVLRRLLQRVRLLLLHLVDPLAREPAVVGDAPDPEVDVAVHGIRVTARDEALDERDDLRHELRRLRICVRVAETEIADVLEIPLRRTRRE